MSDQSDPVPPVFFIRRTSRLELPKEGGPFFWVPVHLGEKVEEWMAVRGDGRTALAGFSTRGAANSFAQSVYGGIGPVVELDTAGSATLAAAMGSVGVEFLVVLHSPTEIGDWYPIR